MTETLRTLQLFYAGALSDAAFHYGRNGIMETVTAEKKKLQEEAAPGQLRHLGITDLKSAYTVLGGIFGCANWNLASEEGCVKAETSGCMLCAIAKKQGSPKPCYPFCINPFSSYARVFGYELQVEETLWEGKKCIFVNTRKEENDK